MHALYLTAYTLTNALGAGKQANVDALLQGRSGLRPNDFPDVDLNTYIGRVPDLERLPVRGDLAAFDCRNNRLAQLTLQQDDFVAAVATAIRRHGRERIALVLGTSTSGILSTELAFKQRDAAGALPAAFSFRHTHDIYSVADFVQNYLQITGPALVVSTACSSSAKVFADAYRLIYAGLADAALVGGVDSLCLTTLYGFNSLELVSPDICRPADAQRNGLSLGEGGGFALLEKTPGESLPPIRLLGYGESSDAHHMSTPHPEGLGARLAMEQALQRAQLAPAQVDYINLHGTATPTNDTVEDKAVSAVFGSGVPGSSTKGWTGHTLGAAGVTEIIFSSLCLEHGVVPRSLNTRSVDPAFGGHIQLTTERRALRTVLSNSFGFGGNNCSLIVGREDS